MRTRNLGLAFVATALTLAPASFGAVAAAETVNRTTGVVHGDLDLSTEGGRAELDRRIDRAAKEVCGLGESTVGTRIRSREARQCYTQAKRDLDQHFAGILRDKQLGG